MILREIVKVAEIAKKVKPDFIKTSTGFGPSGEGYFRLTAFGTYENTVKAIDRIKKL